MLKFFITILVFFFAGCSFKPDMPKLDANFTNSIESFKISQKWWEDFEDENLNLLIQEALKHNSNLALARLNLQRMQKSLNLTNKDFLPNLRLSGAGTRARNSGQTFPYIQSTGNNFSLSALLSYEIDIWGRVRDSSNAAKSLYKASKYDYDGARISIASNVAKAYFTLIAYELEKDILLDTMQTYKNTMLYQQKQFDAGAISELLYLQSVGEYQNAKVRLSDIENNIDLSQSALMLMLGKGLDDILYRKIEASKKFPKSPSIPSGVSSDVLLHRPDVASSYERLKSSNYLVGVARSAYFPSISLTGMFGFQSDELSNLLKPSAKNWSVGTNISSSVLDLGRTSSRVDLAKISQDADVLRYELSIKTALGEVRRSLASYKNAKKAKQSLDLLLNSQKRIYELSLDMFNEGDTSQLQLLDAQRMLLTVKLLEVEARVRVVNSIIDVYRAFGGGFSLDKEE